MAQQLSVNDSDVASDDLVSLLTDVEERIQAELYERVSCTKISAEQYRMQIVKLAEWQRLGRELAEFALC